MERRMSGERSKTPSNNGTLSPKNDSLDTSIGRSSSGSSLENISISPANPPQEEPHSASRRLPRWMKKLLIKGRNMIKPSGYSYSNSDADEEVGDSPSGKEPELVSLTPERASTSSPTSEKPHYYPWQVRFVNELRQTHGERVQENKKQEMRRAGLRDSEIYGQLSSVEEILAHRENRETESKEVIKSRQEMRKNPPKYNAEQAEREIEALVNQLMANLENNQETENNQQAVGQSIRDGYELAPILNPYDLAPKLHAATQENTTGDKGASIDDHPYAQTPAQPHRSAPKRKLQPKKSSPKRNDHTMEKEGRATLSSEAIEAHAQAQHEKERREKEQAYQRRKKKNFVSSPPVSNAKEEI